VIEATTSISGWATGGLRLALVVLPLTLCAACEEDRIVEAANDSFVQWALPDALREISGLALTADQRLFAVSDEEAIVYELDYQTGKLVKAFALGPPTVRADFEGIAVLNDTFWLMTSDGDLYSFAEGTDGQRMHYELHEFAVENKCELEGLAADASRNALILVCKDAQKRKDRQIFVWSMSGEHLQFSLPEKAMADLIGAKRVNPSAIEVDPESGNWIVVAAKQKAVFELSPEGELLGLVRYLDAGRHAQSEGIAITNDGRLLIADEAGDGPARLAVYPMDRL